MATELAQRIPEEVHATRDGMRPPTASVNQMLARIGGSRGLIPFAVIGLAMVAVLMLTRWAMTPGWVTVASGMPLETIGSVTDELDEIGIENKLGPAGTSVAVRQDMAAKARVSLAQEGLTAGSAPGFELFDQPAWGMTEFTQRINLRRALEGELERTISKMRGVESAEVHIAMREASFLQGAGPQAEASVFITPAVPGMTDESIVRGVRALVAGSVEGLTSENVTVLDETGMVLSADPGASGLSEGQLRIREETERYLENKAQTILANLVGPGNAVVRVAAHLNFDRIDRTTQAVDPDMQFTVREDRAEIVPGSAEQGASSTTTNTVNEATRSTEQLQRGGARVERLSVAVLVNYREVPTGDSVIHQPRTAAEIAEVQALVSNAVGVFTGRGDAITVSSRQFDRPEVEPVVDDSGTDYMAIAAAAQRPVIGILGLVVALILGLRAVRSLPKPASAPTLVPPPSQPSLQLVTDPVPAQVTEPAPQRPSVADPNMAAKVVRAWMKEA